MGGGGACRDDCLGRLIVVRMNQVHPHENRKRNNEEDEKINIKNILFSEEILQWEHWGFLEKVNK
jgi:hypothetical protein